MLRERRSWRAEWQPLRECLRLAAGAARNAADLTPLPGKSKAKALLTVVAFASADRPGDLPEILANLLAARGHDDRMLERYEEVNVR